MTKHQSEQEEELVGHAIRQSPVAMVLTDPRLDDNPITYVNDAFQKLTLYSREYAIGRNCRFLQGPDTRPEDIERIKKGLKTEEEFEVAITNHRADGSPFINQLLGAPIHGQDGELTAYFGLQRVQDVELAEKAKVLDDDNLMLLRELQHRVKNHLSMVVSMIRVQARRPVTAESLKAVSRRVEALALLYDELLTAKGHGHETQEIDAGAYLSRIISVISELQDRGAIRINVECEDIRMTADNAARLGLLLSEFLTNALEHAFEGRDSGSVKIKFFRRKENGVRLLVKDDGIGMPEGRNWPFGAPSIETQRERAARDAGELDTTGHGKEPGVGGSIVVAMVQSLHAALHVKSSEKGTKITVDLNS